MKYALIPVTKIHTEDIRFDYYRPDLFGERDRSMPDNPAMTQVILREIPDADEYQIVFGHALVEKLSEDAEVPATVYTAAELTDQDCGRVILEYDRSAGAQLLTHYERACIVRDLGMTMYKAAQTLGVSQPVIKNWLIGAQIYDELVKDPGRSCDGLSFSHLTTLGRLAERYEKLSGASLSIENKIQYLEKCVTDALSVKQFEKWLEQELGLGDKPPVDGDGDDDPVEPPDGGEDGDDDDNDNSTVPEQQAVIDELLLDAGLADEVTVAYKKNGTLKVTAGLSVDALPDLAECLSEIYRQLRAAAQQAA